MFSYPTALWNLLRSGLWEERRHYTSRAQFSNPHLIAKGRNDTSFNKEGGKDDIFIFVQAREHLTMDYALNQMVLRVSRKGKKCLLQLHCYCIIYNL